MYEKMNIKDKFAVMFGNGLDIAGKQADKMRLQAELTKTKSAIEGAYAEFGRTVVQSEGSNASFLSVYGAQVNALRNLEQRAAELQQRITELERAQAPDKAIPTVICSTCGSMVPVTATACPMCGGDISQLRARFRHCPSCNAYYDGDVKFCVVCGSKTEPLFAGAGQTVAYGAVGMASAGNQQGMAEPSQGAVVPPADPVCPGCGRTVSPADAFCGVCGTPLKS